jgi:PAS domain S-box-containing protein
MAATDFRHLLDSIKVPVALVSAQGEVTYANDAFAAATGVPPGEIGGGAIGKVFAESERRRIEQAVLRIAEGKSGASVIEARLERNDRWMQVSLQPARGAKQKESETLVTLQDHAAQRELEAALNLNVSRLLALAESSPNPLLIEGREGQVEVVNQAFCERLGIGSAPQSLLGLATSEVFAMAATLDAAAVDEARRDPRAHAGARILGTGSIELVLEHHPILVEEEPSGVLWRLRALKAEAIAELDEPAERGASQIGLIEKIGHELTVALEGVAAFSIRAQQLEFDHALVEHFQQIRSSTETAFAAIGDLVDFSKVQGGVVLRHSVFSLRATIAELVKRVIHTAEEYHSRLRLKIEQDVADQIEGDVDRLQLLLKNLLDNAFRLAPGGEVLLQITPEYESESGIHLSFSVSITESAEGGDRGHARLAAEAGLGLAVARFMVIAMGGKLVVTSRPGAEALYAFTIEFPVKPALAPPQRATYVSLVGLPVLVVADDPEQRHDVSNLLRGWRMLPLEADNAAMALALLERMDGEASPVPLVIVANQLPVQDGFLLAFRIKHHKRLRRALIMMLAKEGRPGDAIACRENGISAYLRYPANPRQLNDAIIAVTGATVDADDTPTLITRHSLREQRRGATILLVGASRDAQILVSHALRKRDCSVVAAFDSAEAFSALDQEMYDLMLVDEAAPGFDGGDVLKLLRARLTRKPDATTIIALIDDRSPAARKAKVAAGFHDVLARPFKQEDVVVLVERYAQRDAVAE